jgi:hypothetical protein
MGGLGNQLFQIFTTFAYCMRTNRKMVLPYSDSLTIGKARNTYWNTFLTSLKEFTTFTNSTFTNDYLYFLQSYNEPNFNYNPIPNFTNDSIKLVGYFQSYKYFENEKNILFDSIGLSQQQKSIREEFKELLDIESSNTISMHFRLGDYKDIQDCHPLMPYQYYEIAILNIITARDLSKPFRILYFCEKEDIDVVEETIEMLRKSYNFIEFKKVNNEIPDWKQMLLMSCCQDNIIANSTFSWWGAYFNQNEDKLVCYPNKWFGPKLAHNTIDLFPKNWHKIFW